MAPTRQGILRIPVYVDGGEREEIVSANEGKLSFSH